MKDSFEEPPLVDSSPEILCKSGVPVRVGVVLFTALLLSACSGDNITNGEVTPAMEDIKSKFGKVRRVKDINDRHEWGVGRCFLPLIKKEDEAGTLFRSLSPEFNESIRVEGGKDFSLHTMYFRMNETGQTPFKGYFEERDMGADGRNDFWTSGSGKSGKISSSDLDSHGRFQLELEELGKFLIKDCSSLDQILAQAEELNKPK